MKIAVTYENGQVFQHFGHTQQFKIYDIENNQITSSEILDSGDFGHESLAVLLKNKGIELLICGGIGGGAQSALAQQGIDLMGGCNGDADEQIQKYIAGTLDFNPDVTCNEHHHEGSHNCGSGTCGN